MSKMGDRGRIIRENYRMAKQHDPRLGIWMSGVFALVMLLCVGLGVLLDNPVTFVILGLAVGTLAATILFSRRAMRSAYKSIEGQPGAAVAIVQNMAKLGWGITPAVAANKTGDLVHRAIGRPGVILIGEPKSNALAGLVVTERKRTARFVPEIPIHDLVIGNEEGQIPISRLDKHLRKMPNVLSPGEVTQMRKRLDALSSNPLPIPKGPMPKSGRMPKGNRRG